MDYLHLKGPLKKRILSTDIQAVLIGDTSPSDLVSFVTNLYGGEPAV
jgi:hypothetical protein